MDASSMSTCFATENVKKCNHEGTPCTIDNEFGSCPGTFVCGAGGFAATRRFLRLSFVMVWTRLRWPDR